jgi:hypothetical protein
MSQAKTFKQGNDWWVRLPDGRTMNLNTSASAEYLLDLLAELETAQSKRSTSRKKPGPSETK